MRRRFVSVLLLLVLTGTVASCCCAPMFAPDRNVTTLLGPSDVVGTWKLLPESLKHCVRDGFRPDPSYRYTMEFRADGTCVFSSLDQYCISTHGMSGAYLVANGTWVLKHDTKCDSSDKIKNVLEIELDVGTRSREFVNFHFAREKGKLHLWNWYGDPDSWEFLEYER